MAAPTLPPTGDPGQYDELFSSFSVASASHGPIQASASPPMARARAAQLAHVMGRRCFSGRSWQPPGADLCRWSIDSIDPEVIDVVARRRVAVDFDHRTLDPP